MTHVGRLNLRSFAGCLAIFGRSSSARCSDRAQAHAALSLGNSLSFRRIPVRMVEGHQCHRVAHQHRRQLVGKRFAARSPNQRFVEGAKAIDGKPLDRIEVHGKNLFYFFGAGDATVVLHIHFGMSGAFRTVSLPGPEPKPTTRLVLENAEANIAAHLSAMTVQHGDLAFYTAKAAALGPDPLREDADKERLWEIMSGSKRPVGVLLMDQAAVAGIGNIYRAEILFKAGVHPEQPGESVGREAFERLWRHSVLLLQRGFKTGSILTVDPEEAKVLGQPWTRRYVYNHQRCGRCGSAVRTWDMAARTVYACETCQPLITGTQLSPQRAKALAAATATRVFKSHCAPEGPDAVEPAKMSAAELRPLLRSLRLPINGKHAELVARLQAHRDAKAPASPSIVDLAASQEHAQESSEAVSMQPASVEQASPEALEAKKGRSGKRGTAADAPAIAVADGQSADGGSGDDELSGATVAELRVRLRAAGLPTAGRKADLILRLQAAPLPGPTLLAAQPATQPTQPASQADESAAAGTSAEADCLQRSSGDLLAGRVPDGAAGAAGPAADPKPTPKVKKGAGARSRRRVEEAAAAAGWPPGGEAAVQPGTQQLGEIASAEDAVLEKLEAGEGLNVEHVALETDGTAQIVQAKPKAASGGGRAGGGPKAAVGTGNDGNEKDAGGKNGGGKRGRAAGAIGAEEAAGGSKRSRRQKS